MVSLKILVICLFSIVLESHQLSSSSSSKSSSPSISSVSVSSPSYSGFDLGNLSANMSQFDISLYNKIRQHHNDRNIIISPLSVEIALALLYCGSGGHTSQIMEKALYLNPTNREQIASDFSDVTQSLQKGHLVDIANGIYLQNGFNVREKFNTIATQDFNSTVQTIDFANSSAATTTINNFVANKTDDKIINFFPKGSLSPSTDFVLVNAIYFKGEWAMPFPKANTKMGKFHHDKCKPKDVRNMEMMNVKGLFRYGSSNELQADFIELPYKHSDLSMLIILPHKCDGLDAVEDELTKIDFCTIDNYLNYATNCDVTIPKFEIELSSKMLPPLIDMGFGYIFGPNANFSNMVVTDKNNNALEPPSTLSLSDFIHKAIITVTESGTTAAAASGGFMNFNARPGVISNQVVFTADHPFVFMIRDPSSILFMGRLRK